MSNFKNSTTNLLPTGSNNTKRLRMPWTAEEDDDAYVMQKEMAECCRNNKPIRTYTSQGLRRRLQVLEIKHIKDTGSGYGFPDFTNEISKGNYIRTELGISEQNVKNHHHNWTEEEDQILMTNYMRVGLRCEKCGQRFTWYSAAYSMRKEMAKFHPGQKPARIYTPSILCRRWRRLKGKSDVSEDVAWQIYESLEGNTQISEQIVEDEDVMEILKQIIKDEDITETSAAHRGERRGGN
ncbi:hypothetical protein HYALB_00013127 [Hymenoscyphus albidus]|uniref:C2H2-type domain-containing protein n=1 Tax=Hymenoscyphus albidus TaxID=595503 RepID=A0A9N9QA75_9HELO|nr:hypothetical protein HYALB_00013127 [Hymenoscyphus albidus]